MKPIKFRAWHKADEKMYEVYGFAQNKSFRNHLFWFLKGKQFPMPNGAVVIMQYTGFKDRNGREIYEGDIFRDNDCFLWEVYWEDGSFWAKGGEYDVSEHLIEFVPDWCEVVGNIYEHTHLLEVQHD